MRFYHTLGHYPGHGLPFGTRLVALALGTSRNLTVLQGAGPILTQAPIPTSRRLLRCLTLLKQVLYADYAERHALSHQKL